MIDRIFISLCKLPGFKKKLWRTLYDYLAHSQTGPDWTFMNYGYAATEGPALILEDADEPDRSCIQLYHRVAGGVDLERSTVLEVGSGRGGGASFIKRYMRPERMIGLDLSKHAVEFCIKRHPVEGLEFRSGDAEHLPFEDGSVDAVINVESSHCYPSFETFLAEACRVLRPGGHFLYADFRDRASVEAWRDSLRHCGLSVLRETEITNNVLIALDRDHERKLGFINRIVPKPLRASFSNFAAMRGTAVFEGFRNGSLAYWSFVLRKAHSTL